MSDISLSSVHTQMSRSFKTEGAGSTRFNDDFISAVNMSSRQMNRDANLSSEISLVSNINDTIGLDEMYLDVLISGIMHYLMILGQRPQKGAEAALASAATRFAEGISSMYYDLMNDEQETATNNIVGLGSLVST
jgi:hypothetical protein